MKEKIINIIRLTLEGFLLLIAGTFLFIIVLNVNNMTYLRNKISDLEKIINKQEKMIDDLKKELEQKYTFIEAQSIDNFMKNNKIKEQSKMIYELKEQLKERYEEIKEIELSDNPG